MNHRLTDEYWYDEKGELHRDKDKPAWITYDKEGKVKIERYYFHGEHIKSLKPQQKKEGEQDETRKPLHNG